MQDMKGTFVVMHNVNSDQELSAGLLISKHLRYCRLSFICGMLASWKIGPAIHFFQSHFNFLDFETLVNQLT